MRLGRPMRRAGRVAGRRARDLGKEGGGVDLPRRGNRRQRREAREPLAQPRGGREIGFAESEPVCERDLPARLAMPVERIEAVGRIDQRRDIGEPQSRRERRIGEQGVQDRPGIGEARGLHHNAAKRQFAGVATREQPLGAPPRNRRAARSTGSLTKEARLPRRAVRTGDGRAALRRTH